MIVVDCEMSGLKPVAHSLLSIGALDFSNPTNQFYAECHAFDGASIDASALEVNGFSYEQAIDLNKQSEAELITSFIEWSKTIENKNIAGQNVALDRDMLNIAAKRAGLEWDAGKRIVDLHSICFGNYLQRDIVPPQEDGFAALSLDAILEYVGMPPEPKPHIGINGAKLEAEAFARLLLGKGLLDEYQSYKLPVYLL